MKKPKVRKLVIVEKNVGTHFVYKMSQNNEKWKVADHTELRVTFIKLRAVQ